MEPLELSVTSEIAEELGWSRRTTYEVLNRLADRRRFARRNPKHVSDLDSTGIAVGQ
jgi:DNA-binding IclR family transcriptional regulator